MTFEPIVSINSTTPAQYKNFSCNKGKLDEFLKRYALKNERLNLTRSFVIVTNKRVIGYYTLNAAQILITDLPEAYKQKLPQYPVPACRLCKLAVDGRFQGQNIGKYLLFDAINRAMIADSNMAIHSLIVDAKDEEAKEFYLKYGFMTLEGSPLSFFLPLSTLRQASRHLSGSG